MQIYRCYGMCWHIDRLTLAASMHTAYQKRMEDWSPITFVLSKFSWVWSSVMMLLTVVINVLILATWEAPVSFLDPEPEYNVS
jgi:hypothetical protein